jgi:YD repeat-containing protein
LKETYPDLLSRSYTYDPVGNLLTRTDQIGQTTTYSYSDLYFLTSRAYPFSGADTMTYDLSGRMLSAQRGSWPDTFSYDGANRLIQTVQNGNTISYVYNIPAKTRQITYPGGRVIIEHTDFRARMDHINDAAFPASIVQYTYDLANNVLSRNYRNGTTSAFTYNANNWTTNIAHSNPAVFAQFGYAYDNEGNKQFENKTPQDPTHSEGYQYDSTYRLINYQVGTLVGSTITVPTTQTSYSLDPVGNWNSKATNSVTQNRQHNADNELIKINAQGLTYDNNGNLTNDGSFAYAYDEENRLTVVTRVSDSAVVGQYQYDALSRRVQTLADPAGTPSTTLYFYDDSRVIQDQNSLAVTPATYVFGNYVDEVLTMDLGGNVYYYHQNALWSVEAITDSTAAPVER